MTLLDDMIKQTNGTSAAILKLDLLKCHLQITSNQTQLLPC